MILGGMILFLGNSLQITILAQEQPPKKVKVVPDPGFTASGLHRFLLGKEYRDLWVTPIKVEFLDLKTFAGGLTPTGTGGGMQSLGLRFVGADGRPYTFRPMQKSLLELLPEELRETFVKELVNDQVSSAFPTAPPVIPVLLDAVNVLHNTPRIIVIPNDPLLGEYQDHFAGQVGTIEEWPNESEGGKPGFAGATEVHSTDELFALLRSDPTQRVDAHNYLTARFMDLIIGDWDRHLGQWRWANVGDGSPPAWMPIPEDRDQAFAKYDGLLIDLVRFQAPQLTKFGPKYSAILGMTWNGRKVDHRLLVGLNRSDWEMVVKSVVSRLDDAVIDAALRELPPSHYELAAAETAENLKIRRDKLTEIAEKYYRHLASEVDIQATDTNDIIEAVRLEDGRLELSVFATLDRKNILPPTYHRIFEPKDTNDVRIFLHGGDDRVTVSGDGPDTITLRIVSEAGRNEVTDTSKVGGTKVYDDRKQGGATVQGAKLNQEPYTPPKPVMFALPPRDWGSSRLYTGEVDINGDLGLLLGVGVARERYGFRRDPFASRWRVSLAYATRLNNFRLGAAYDVTKVNSRIHGSVEFTLSGIESLSFYGYGNETPEPEDHHFADVNRRVISLKPNANVSLSPHWNFRFGALMEYSKTEDKPDTIAGNQAPYGSGYFWQGGILTELVYDTLDSHAWPSRGMLFWIKGAYYPELLDIEDGDYGSVEGLLAGVYPLTKRFVVAGRVAGRKIWGHYPYFQAAYLGGSRVLRGYATQRFAGDASFYANLELRFPIARLTLVLPGEYGIFAFVDTGRVFFEGETSNKWHTGYGVGLWVAPIMRQLTMSLAAAGSDEGPRFYFRFGFGF